MKLIVGLGNPGEKYRDNRHNAGCFIIRQMRLSGWPVPYKGPCNDEQNGPKDELVFMSGSGALVLSELKKYSRGVVPSRDLLVIHDDLDIKLGDYKLQFAKGPRQHTGVLSVEEAIGKDFWRLRVGVESRSAEIRTAGEDYVLEDFLPEEREEIIKLVSGQPFFFDMRNWLLKTDPN